MEVAAIASLLIIVSGALLAYWFALPTHPTTYIILIGNPGAGKSTILNGILGKPAFGSGISLGEGYTKTVRLARASKTLVYGDTPGLDDATNRVRASKEISKALKSGNGNYKILFVVNQDGGRVRPSDGVTMKLVLDALPDKNAPYGIVVNKVTKPVQKMLEETEGGMETFLACLNQGRENITPFIHLYPYIESLHDQENALHPVRPEFVQFLDLLPSFPLQPSIVQDVYAHDYEQLSTQIKQEMQELRNDKEKIQEENRKIRQKLEQYPSFTTGVLVGAGVALGGTGIGVIAVQTSFEQAAIHAAQIAAQKAAEVAATKAQDASAWLAMAEAGFSCVKAVLPAAVKLMIGIP